MRGIYTVKRRSGVAVYISYTPPGEARVRELVELVSRGREFSRRLGEAERRAEKILIKRKAAIIEGRHEIARPQKTMSLSLCVDRWYADELRERKGGLRSAEKEIQRLTTGPVGRALGSVKLADLTEWKIRSFVKSRQDDGVGPGAINRDLARLSNLWNSAKKRKLVRGDNPVAEYGRLSEPQHRVRFLDPAEEAKLLGELKGDLRRLVEVALHTGIRLGALLGLRWLDVDWRLDQIVVPDTLSKSRKAYMVPMNSRVRELLRELVSRGAFTGPEDYVFCKRDGSRRTSVRTAFQGACERAGLQGFRFHDLRHTAASRIVMAGGSLLDAGQHLGHSTPTMTLRYAHLSADHRARIAELTRNDSVASLSRERARRKSEGA